MRVCRPDFHHKDGTNLVSSKQNRNRKQRIGSKFICVITFVICSIYAFVLVTSLQLWVIELKNQVDQEVKSGMHISGIHT